MFATIADGVRTWRRDWVQRPLLQAATIAILAVAIGESTTIAVLLDSVILTAAPFPHAERLFIVECGSAEGAGNCPILSAVRIRDEAPSLDDVAYARYGPSKMDTGTPLLDRLITRKVSYSFFSTLGTRPILGRWFLESDERGSDDLVVLSYATWRTKFAAAGDVAGSAVKLDGRRYIVSGVMPAQFTFPDSTVDAWVLDRLTLQQLERGNSYDAQVVVRLSEGSTPDALESELRVIAARLPDLGQEKRLFRVVPLADSMMGPATQVVWVLFWGALALFIVLTLSVVHLWRIGAQVRGHEHVIRHFLGASGGRLWAHIFVQNLCTAILAVVAGLLAAYAVLNVFSLAMWLDVSRAELAAVRWPAVGYGLALAVGIALIGTPAVSSALRHTSAGVHLAVGPGRLNTARVSLAIQLSVAVVVCGMATAALETLWRIRGIPFGFDADGVMAVSLVPAQSDGVRKVSSFAEQVRNSPHVTGVAIASYAPLTGAREVIGVRVDPDSPSPRLLGPIQLQAVSDSYFSLLHIPFIAGRGFLSTDSTAGECVAVISASVAKAWRGPSDALGHSIEVPALRQPRCHVIGVVADVRDKRVADMPGPELYVFWPQYPKEGRAVIIRTRRPKEVRAAAIAAAQATGQQISVISAPATIIHDSTKAERVLSWVILVFAISAYIASLSGMLGATNAYVRGRRRDIGIRLALGASGRQVAALLIRQYGITVVAGISLGALLCTVLGRSLVAWSPEFRLFFERPILSAAAVFSCLPLAIAVSLRSIRSARLPDLLRRT